MNREDLLARDVEDWRAIVKGWQRDMEALMQTYAASQDDRLYTFAAQYRQKCREALQVVGSGRSDVGSDVKPPDSPDA